MNSIKELPKRQRVFFENEKGEIQYNEDCLSCANECKQAFRVKLIACSSNIKCKTPMQYLNYIKRNKLFIKDIAYKIKIHTKTLESMLIGNQDMTPEVHKKLMKELYNKDIKIN